MSAASTGCRYSVRDSPRSASRTGMASPGGSSAALTAVATPLARRAFVMSTARTLPCATGERTILAHSSPRAWKPSVKAPRPRNSRGSSLRGTAVPVTVIGGSRSRRSRSRRSRSRRSRSRRSRSLAGPGHRRVPVTGGPGHRRSRVTGGSGDSTARVAARPGGGQHRRNDALVPGAAAEVGRDEFPDLRLGRLLIRPGRWPAGRCGGWHEASFGKICLGQHQEAWRAKPALQRVLVAECLLQVGQVVAGGQALHGADLGAVGLHPEDQAGAHRRAVQPYRARAADTVLAAHGRTGVTEVVAEHVGERPPGLHQQFVLGAVDPQPHLMLVRHAASSPDSCSAGTAPAPASAALTSAGSTGMWSKLTPVPLSASLTALSTHPGAPIMPPSPMPLAPLSLKADGVCRWITSTGHISAAVGTR